MKICKACFVPHAENCPRCFGFGLTPKGDPLPAGEAFDMKFKWWKLFRWKKCPVCNGTPMGMKP
jgi:hypothetical protein